MLSTFWYGMKNFQANPNTSLDAKTKELIGVAVAAQIPCEYCVYFHTVAAKKAGASDQEIKEAVGMAAMTRMGSTLLNGAQIDKVQFRKDVDRIMARDEKSKVQARKP
jgi:AhpD family alkylhydroperoxidase